MSSDERTAALLEDIQKHWGDRRPTDLQFCTCGGCQRAGFFNINVIEHATDFLRAIALNLR